MDIVVVVYYWNFLFLEIKYRLYLNGYGCFSCIGDIGRVSLLTFILIVD